MDFLTSDEKRILLFFAAVCLSGVLLQGLFWLFPSARRHIAIIDNPFISPKTNLNRADYAQLVLLPGLGPGAANRILEYRALHGRFLSVDELKAVPGLKSTQLQDALPWLEVR